MTDKEANVLLSEERRQNAAQEGMLLEEPQGRSDADAENDEQRKSEVPDGGWGWMVVFGCFLMHLLLGGYSRSFAITYVEIQERFGSSAAITSWIGGINVGLRFFLGPVATALSAKWGVRPVVMAGGVIMAFFSFLCGWAPNEYFLFFSYSIGTAFGGALIYAPALVLVNQYFDRRRSMATGLASAGSGLGVFIFPPLIEILFSYYGFSGAFIILGGICLNNCVAGALYRPVHHVKRAKKRVDEKISLDSMKSPSSRLQQTAHWFNKHFGLSYLGDTVFGSYCLAMTLITLSYVSGHQLLVALAKENGIPETKAVFILSVIGISDTIGRVLSGFVFDIEFLRSKRQLYYCCFVFFSSAFMFAMGFSKDYWSFILYGTLQGFFNGIVVCQRAVVIVDIVGIDKLSACFGLCTASQGFGVVFGPMIAGLLKDIYGNYLPSYIFIGVSSSIGGFILLFSALRFEFLNRKSKKSTLSLEVT